MKNFRFYVVAVAFVLSGVIFSCSKSKTEEVLDLSGTKTESIVTDTNADSQTNGTNADSAQSPNTAQSASTANPLNPSAEQPEEQKCFVYVCGAVAHPDVYELRPGSRIVDAIRVAGGFADNAAEAYLNLADFVADGMKINVPTEKEIEDAANGTAGMIGFGITIGTSNVSGTGNVSGAGNTSGTGNTSAAGSSQTSGKININTATAEELKTLSGIGDARAADIISYRSANGSFQSIEDIMRVPGIKSAAFAKIKDYITVE